MKRAVRYFASGALLLAILCALILEADRVLVVKSFYTDEWPTQASFASFYRMRRDTVDAIILGSSHVMTSCSPQQIYDEYGIRSFTLSGEELTPLAAYFWLQEALKTQSPQVVLFDVYKCFDELGVPLGMPEGTARKQIQALRLSPVKWAFAKAMEAVEPTQKASENMLASFRFHSRWAELREEDFTSREMSAHGEMKGFSVKDGSCGENYVYAPFERGSSDEREEMMPVMERYLEKMAELCAQNGVRLVLIKTPTTTATIARYNAAEDFARSHGLDYRDMNEKALADALAIDYHDDFIDYGHANYRGARKISALIGRMLAEDYGVAPVADEQWENSREFCRAAIEDAELTHVTDIHEYLNRLDLSRHVVFVAVRRDAADAMDDAVREGLRALGLNAPIWRGSSYYGVASAEGAREEGSDQLLVCRGTLRGGRTTYEVTSGGADCGDTCLISIGGEQRSKNSPGLNIVVYNPTMKRVVDSVYYSAGLSLNR